MNFLNDLFDTKELLPFLAHIFGNNFQRVDFLILIIGVYVLQRVIYGRAGFFLLFAMTLFTVLLHYNSDTALSYAIQHAYSIKGIGYFRQEIFIAIPVLILAFLLGRVEQQQEEDTSSFLIPTFIMIESLNIISGIDGTKVTHQLLPFWGVLIILIIFFGIAIEADKDNKIEKKILEGTASDSDKAYWYKRKKEKEEEDNYYMQQQYYDK
jgi:hypothetical protein